MLMYILPMFSAHATALLHEDAHWQQAQGKQLMSLDRLWENYVEDKGVSFGILNNVLTLH